MISVAPVILEGHGVRLEPLTPEDRDGLAAAAADGVDAELLATYEGLRGELGGIAVARLVGSVCGGCHLGLSAVEVDRIKKQPPDALVRCDECGRLLVR